MKELIDNTFKNISGIKKIKNHTLIINSDDIYYMKAYYRRIKQYISYKTWENIVINYSIETMEDIFTSGDILLDAIIKKYEK